MRPSPLQRVTSHPGSRVDPIFATPGTPLLNLADLISGFEPLVQEVLEQRERIAALEKAQKIADETLRDEVRLYLRTHAFRVYFDDPYAALLRRPAVDF